ncbi:MAG: biopolymer transporter ExbD [Bacteroidetes bacterium]|nr:biopolymer transporter ExbD [Bacteroidota bacterium]
MAKVKVPRKSTTVDMTAMTDVAFLLLTFFMLATQFKPDEPVQVVTPSSISQIPLPDVDIMNITIAQDGRVFFDMEGKQYKEKLIQKMGEKYTTTFTPQQIEAFSRLSSFGMPFKELSGFLSLKPDERTQIKQVGIPSDSLNNELADWVWQARLTNNNVRVAIKGDGNSTYPIVAQVIKTLQEKKVNRFNFITSAETAPPLQ